MWPPRTLVVTDRRRLPMARRTTSTGIDAEVDALVAFVSAVARAGADAVQVRERDWADGRLLDAVRALRESVAGTGCRLLVNERLHVALAAGADGVHLRSDGMPIARIRMAAGRHVLVGRSVHEDDVEAAHGADYALFGTVFASFSKGPDAPVAGLERLAASVARAGVPVVAIGGMSLERAPSVRDVGACGLAGIDLFAAAYVSGPAALAEVIGTVHAIFSNRGQAR